MKTELSRREMLLMSALAVAAFSPIGRALAAPGGAGVDAGEVGGFPKDGVFDQFAAQGFFVIRKDGRIVAQSSLCTHKRGKLTPTAEGFFCKLHNSSFSSDGKVTRPPARMDLVRFAVHLDERNHLIVDMSKRIEHGQFDTPGAFVEAPTA